MGAAKRHANRKLKRKFVKGYLKEPRRVKRDAKVEVTGLQLNVNSSGYALLVRAMSENDPKVAIPTSGMSDEEFLDLLWSKSNAKSS